MMQETAGFVLAETDSASLVCYRYASQFARYTSLDLRDWDTMMGTQERQDLL